MQTQIKPCAKCGEYPYFDDLNPFAVRCRNPECPNGRDYVARHENLNELTRIWNDMQSRTAYSLCILIPGELPSLNDIIDADRRNRFVGAKLKRNAMAVVAPYLPHTPISTPVTVNIHFCSKTARRDPDNIAAGGTKIIFDAMQRAGILENDGQKQIAELHYTFSVDAKNPHIMAIFTPTVGCAHE